MKRFLLSLMATGLAFVSCSRNNDDTPIVETVEIPILPTKIEWKSTPNGDSYRAVMDFTYDGNKIKESVIKINYASGTQIVNQQMKYHYTGDKITSVDYYTDWDFDGNYDKEVLTFDYNDDGTVKRSSTNSKFVYNNIKNGNLLGYTEFDDRSSLLREYIHTYDDKNGPFKNVKGLQEIAPELYANFISAGFEHQFNYFMAFNNNMTSTTETSYYLSSGKVSAKKTYTYEYNSRGYPISAVEKHEEMDYNIPIEFITTFTYNR